MRNGYLLPAIVQRQPDTNRLSSELKRAFPHANSIEILPKLAVVVFFF